TFAFGLNCKFMDLFQFSDYDFAAADDGTTPVASHFTSRTFSNQIQEAFREWRLPGITDPSADQRPHTEASYHCSVGTATPRDRRGAHPDHPPSGSDAVTLVWEFLRKRSGMVSYDHLREVSLTSASGKILKTPKRKSRQRLKGRAHGGISGWMECSSFQVDCSPTRDCGRAGRHAGPLCVWSAATAPLGRNFHGVVCGYSSVDSLKENGNKVDGK
ncbi:hypothetical protein MJT46_018659, partial [Ovis ammon polii x Ovis aries]